MKLSRYKNKNSMYIFYNVEEKLIGKTPTLSNVGMSKSGSPDNDLYFGKYSDQDAYSLISNITQNNDLSESFPSDVKEFRMHFKEKLYTVIFKISTDGHLQLNFKMKDIFEVFKLDQNISKYVFVLDFKKMRILYERIDLIESLIYYQYSHSDLFCPIMTLLKKGAAELADIQKYIPEYLNMSLAEILEVKDDGTEQKLRHRINGALKALKDKGYIEHDKNTTIRSITSIGLDEFDWTSCKKDIRSNKRICGGKNVLYFGAPGTGKSYKVNTKYSRENGYDVTRILFHPDYTYYDFIGQIYPISKNGSIDYKFVKGPFTSTMLNAIKNPEKGYVLIIEELNRGNASSIFGDIFQLLDRNEEGYSEFPIKNNLIIDNCDEKIFQNDEITIPSNMWIVATANTSDQNTFVMDTAFLRRWEMEYIWIDYNDFKDSYNFTFEGSSKVLKASNWVDFVKNVNEFLLDQNDELMVDDKLIGLWFIKENKLELKKFIDKVIRYLYEDVLKHRQNVLFSSSIRSLMDIRKILLDGIDKEVFSPEFIQFVNGRNNELI